MSGASGEENPLSVKVGIDVAKELHWVVAISEDGKVLINRKMPNTPTAIGELIGELHALDLDVTVGVDMTAGIAGLLLAMLVEAGVRCVYLRAPRSLGPVGRPAVGRTRPTRAMRGRSRTSCGSVAICGSWSCRRSAMRCCGC